MSGTLTIMNDNVLYYPLVSEGVEWSTERTGTAGKLTFKVHKDSKINFQEGNPVCFNWNDKNIFYGFVFSKKRDKTGVISVTAYDQLRYLKNKDIMVYENITADEVIKKIATQFNLQVGTLVNTEYKIPSRVENNSTLFDIIQNALSLTTTNQKQMYVFYDDYGKLTLKNLSDMKTDFLITEKSGENYDYTSSIDGETYNQIKLIYEDSDGGKREVYEAKDSSTINKWGILQYFDTLQKGENGKAKADALLDLYNHKTRNLQFKNLFGRPDIRAGSLILIKMNLGDISTSQYMMVEKCTHIFKNDEYFMNLDVKGGEFS